MTELRVQTVARAKGGVAREADASLIAGVDEAVRATRGVRRGYHLVSSGIERQVGQGLIEHGVVGCSWRSWRTR
jgi:hypothetical protein